MIAIENAFFAGVYVAYLLDMFWPWDWSGRPKRLTLKRRRRPWDGGR